MNTILSFNEAVELVKAGRTLIYPTETFYALGCSCFATQALERVAWAKGRPSGKPMPLIIGSKKQLQQVTAPLTPVLEQGMALVERFWPGPLSVVLPARKALDKAVVSQDGLVAVRLTSHGEAARLCRMADAPMAASSANLSGCPPCSLASQLPGDLLELVGGVFTGDEPPAGGQPSTVIRLDLDRAGVAEVLRPGAVSADQLRDAGFSIR